ncbi:class I SAM-dependent methyltransferase [Albimonas pacifica]|uniref:Methyltransferase domain-containing protein n=1 Tax=Albimonas pacifica TaxID=1114924 RepID=A0A1I3BXW2_9RHOB|nr:class I SAM-dependent methyltransferase [Albimonas pacifica]SFH67053.1 Methyltransferase domain-containing protein [Albimonas pacifica]
MNIETPATADLTAVKAKQQATWAAGDYPAVGATLQIVGERLAEAMDLRPDDRVLDVAAGNGNATLAAARRFCNVVSTDYVESWLKAGMARAEAERLPVAFRVADAEDLPFDDGSFDAVLSTFGVMFTADQEAAAGELARVCRPGGRIGLANWTPEGFIGQLFRTIGRHVPPPPGVRSPLEWGAEARIDALLRPGARAIEFNRREFVFRFRSPAHWIELWRRVYGPMNKAFLAVGPEGAAALEADLAALAREASVDETAMIVPAEYAEIIVYRA